MHCHGGGGGGRRREEMDMASHPPNLGVAAFTGPTVNPTPLFSAFGGLVEGFLDHCWVDGISDEAVVKMEIGIEIGWW
jgi:hypothetical protein